MMKHIRGNKKNLTLYSIVLVYSTSHAIRAEKLLKNAGIHCRLVPVPRHLSSDCGVSVRIEQKDKKNARDVFHKYHFEYHDLHDIGSDT